MRVAAPAVVTMLSYTAMQFVDLLIVSHLGSEAISAVGNGGITAFVPAAAMFGVVGVISTYVSQNLGAGTPERGSAYAWSGLWLSAVVWVVVLLPFAALLPEIQALMRGALGLTVDPRIAGLEAIYGRILVAGMLLTIWARALSHFFYGVHRPKAVMLAALVGNGVNVPLTWALVNGVWGAPEMGVAGAAIGTVLGGFVEFGILFSVFISPAFDGPFRTRSAWRGSWRAVRDIWKIGWPAGLMFGNEMVCWWVFMAGLVASFGPIDNTAGMIVLRYMHVSFMPAVGLSLAVTAVVGKCIGMGRVDLAARRTRLGLALGMGYMGLCALAMVVLREPAVRLFVVGMQHGNPADLQRMEQVVALGASLLVLAAGFQLFDAMAIIMVGALRGAGDTLWPGIATVVASWVLIVGLGSLLAHQRPDLGSYGPWIGAAAYIVILSVVLLLRYRSGAWKRMNLLGTRPERGLAVDAGEGVVPELPAMDVPVDGAKAGKGA